MREKKWSGAVRSQRGGDSMASHKFIVPLVLMLAAAGVVLLPAQAQEKKAGPGQAKHIIHIVKLGSAKDIAAGLTRQFQGEAEVERLAEPDGNVLLIAPQPPGLRVVLQAL